MVEFCYYYIYESNIYVFVWRVYMYSIFCWFLEKLQCDKLVPIMSVCDISTRIWLMAIEFIVFVLLTSMIPIIWKYIKMYKKSAASRSKLLIYSGLFFFVSIFV